MIIFPLFPSILAVFLKIFAEELIIYRFFQVLIYIGIITQVFRIFEKIGLNNRIRNYIIISAFFMFLFIYCIVEYNIFCVFLLLTIINVELGNIKNAKKQMIIGILSGLIIVTKQSIGIISLICSMFVVVLSNKNNVQKIKTIAIRCLFMLIPLLIMFLYLIYNNAIEQFFNYTIFGLKDFTQNKLSYIHLIVYGDFIVSLMALLTPFMYLYIIYRLIKYKIKDNILIIFVIYSISGLSIMFPIMDAGHFLPANILPVITFMYIKKDKESDEHDLNEVTKVVNIFSVILLIIIFATGIYNFLNASNYKHYKYIDAQSNEERLSEVISFIKKHPNTYIMDASAVLYMIPVDKYNGILDMILIGNIGNNGEEYVISQIKKLKDAYILIDKDSNWQNNIEIIQFIEQNYVMIEEVADFKVYKIEGQAPLRSPAF